jgi:Putative Actinobacterial Holin-X, holin superfamily III
MFRGKTAGRYNIQMEEKKDTQPPLFDQLKDYADTQIKLAKYDAIDRSSKFMASFITDMIVGVIFVLAFLFISFAIAFVLANWLGSKWAGFGCMAGIYIIMGLIIIWQKDRIQVPLVNLFIKKFFGK